MNTFNKRYTQFFKIIITAFIMTSIMFTLSSCNQGGDYKKPNVSIPSYFRGSEAVTEQVNSNLGQLFWWEFLKDDTLKKLITTAIVQNYDARLASEKILEAQARLGIARSSQYPNVSGAAQYLTTKVSEIGTTPVLPGSPLTVQAYQANLQASYEIDFWGKYSRATDSARFDMLSSEEAVNTVLMTLVSEVATSYFQLREYDMELEISKMTLESREESLTLVTARQEGGVATMMDVDQAKGLVLTVQQTITQTEQQISIQEDYLSFLLGMNPQDIPRGNALLDQMLADPLPVGLPSSLLENRPDIRQAELQLLSANAKIDVARAAYFPKITLTGQDGNISTALTNLFTGPASTWTYAANLAQPIFDAGLIKSQVKVAESQQRQAVISYEKTVQQAFKEVSDSIILYKKSIELLKQQTDITNTLADQSSLAKMRYEGGVTSYLEVLDTERQYFSSELDLAKSQLNVLSCLIKLYKSLGGGWKQNPDIIKEFYEQSK